MKVFIVDGLRTPVGKTKGALKSFLPEELGGMVLKGLLKKQSLPTKTIDMLIMANAVGPGGNLARLSLLEANFPVSIPAITIDNQCGGGLSSINLAASLIESQQCHMIVAGGMESTSLAPRKQFHPMDPRFEGEDQYFERAPFSPKKIGDPGMIEGAEATAKLMKISREEMDRWTLESHRRAFEATVSGVLKEYILPVETSKGVIDRDEGIRSKMSIKLLDRMPSLLERGNITAGNACLTHDGAAVVLLASEAAVKNYGLQPKAQFIKGLHRGGDPNYPPLAPIETIKSLLTQLTLSIEDIDAVEINEAFAVKILACCRELNIPLNKVNILGGALAYGHPYGASGAMILLHLMKVLKLTKKNRGLAALGIGGGQGVAAIIEMCR